MTAREAERIVQVADQPEAVGEQQREDAAEARSPVCWNRALRVVGAIGEKIPRRMPSIARAAALLLATAGCVLLVVAEFSTLYEIRVITVVKEATDGHEHHDYALLVIAVAAAFMAYGAILGGARPAQYALLALAVAALAVVLLIDYPDVNDEGFIGEAFERAEATPQTGFYLESLGAVLLLISAAATLLLGSGGVQPRVESSEPPAE